MKKKLRAMTAGTITPRVAWYLNDHTTRTVVASSFTGITAVQGWTP